MESFERCVVSAAICWTLGFADPIHVVNAAAPEACHACDDPDSPDCLHIKDAAGYSTSFKGLHQALSDGNAQTLKDGGLAKLFRIDPKKDPCKRQDTEIVDHSIKNEGLFCVLTSSVDTGAAKEKIHLIVKPKFEATYVTHAQTHIVTTGSNAVTLSFENPALDADWGGPLRSVEFSPSFARFQVQKGCIEFSY